MGWDQRLLRLKILGVVVGGVLRVHLLFPHFAHEAGREPAVQGRGHFGVSKSRSLLPLPFRRRRRRLPLLHLPARTRRPPPPSPPPPLRLWFFCICFWSPEPELNKSRRLTGLLEFAETRRRREPVLCLAAVAGGDLAFATAHPL